MKKTYESDRENKIRKIVKTNRLDKHKNSRYNITPEETDQGESELRYFSNSNVEKKRQYL